MTKEDILYKITEMVLRERNIYHLKALFSSSLSAMEYKEDYYLRYTKIDLSCIFSEGLELQYNFEIDFYKFVVECLQEYFNDYYECNVECDEDEETATLKFYNIRG